MRNSRVALFDGIEEGGIRSSSSYSHEIDEHENERAMEGLQDRVNLLKRFLFLPVVSLTKQRRGAGGDPESLFLKSIKGDKLQQLSGDIHEEVDSHNRMLDRMGNDMDASRGILSGTIDKFK
ncbi:hypothetical protein Golax_017183, partial [Gossypium laxum]|nr:hypothetical protein [Gossypium laxum]